MSSSSSSSSSSTTKTKKAATAAAAVSTVSQTSVSQAAKRLLALGHPYFRDVASGRASAEKRALFRSTLQLLAKRDVAVLASLEPLRTLRKHLAQFLTVVENDFTYPSTPEGREWYSSLVKDVLGVVVLGMNQTLTPEQLDAYNSQFSAQFVYHAQLKAGQGPAVAKEYPEELATLQTALYDEEDMDWDEIYTEVEPLGLMFADATGDIFRATIGEYIGRAASSQHKPDWTAQKCGGFVARTYVSTLLSDFGVKRELRTPLVKAFQTKHPFAVGLAADYWHRCSVYINEMILAIYEVACTKVTIPSETENDNENTPPLTQLTPQHKMKLESEEDMASLLNE
jgi:hypothetical protein